MSCQNWLRRALVCAVLSGVTKLSYACSGVPDAYLQSLPKMVADSKAIVLAEYIGHRQEGQGIVFEFKPIEILKGTAKKKVTVSFKSYPDRDARLRGEGDVVVDHVSYDFWVNRRGRAGYAADCNIYPGFAVGSHYLLFLEAPVTLRSFEEVKSATDVWYLAVKDATR